MKRLRSMISDDLPVLRYAKIGGVVPYIKVGGFLYHHPAMVPLIGQTRAVMERWGVGDGLFLFPTLGSDNAVVCRACTLDSLKRVAGDMRRVEAAWDRRLEGL